MMEMMNVNNKKGFVFVELLIVTCILMVGLVIIYKQFSSSISIQKQKLKYNTVADTYKLYYTVLEYISQTEVPECISVGDNNYNCYDFRQYIEKKIDSGNYYMTINTTNTTSAFNAREVILTECGSQNGNVKYDDLYTILKAKMKISSDLKIYFKKIKTCEKLDHYRFIGEFKNPITNSNNYSNIEYP